MAQRKSLSKKIRFEVFKRDSFTCQYCGSKAPDKILEVDHINPVANGGGDDIMNLVTSCFDCNRGKSDRKISDGSVIEKQRRQIEELNIRRQQLEMMLEWKNGLDDISNSEVLSISEYITKLTDNEFELNENGMDTLKKQIKKFGSKEILEATDIAFTKYYTKGSEGFNLAFNKIGAIANINRQPEYMKKIAYAKGIIRNRGLYLDDRLITGLMKEYYEAGYCMDQLIDYCKGVKNFSQLRYWLSDL